MARLLLIAVFVAHTEEAIQQYPCLYALPTAVLAAYVATYCIISDSVVG